MENPVEATPDIYEYIVFRGKDIKDLHVCAPPPTAAAPKLPQDPAIIAQAPLPAGPAAAAPQPAPVAAAAPAAQAAGAPASGPTRPAKRAPQHRPGVPTPATGAAAAPVDEFDFEAANRRFNKEAEYASITGTGAAASESAEGTAESVDEAAEKLKALGVSGEAKKEPGYDKKKSFFDSISTDRSVRAQSTRTEGAGAMQQRVNVETFGDAAFRRGRGRGRGGYGRGRGRGGYGHGGRGRGGRSHGSRPEGGSSGSDQWRASA